MLHIYDIRTDARTQNKTLTHRADVKTWRETHAYRRLQKYQRQELSGGKTATPVTTAVYDDQGNLLAREERIADIAEWITEELEAE